MIWLVLALAALQQPSPPTLAFHHLHYRVDDPASAMNAAAARLGGTRVLLQGLGVGVRTGDGHLLFERRDGTEHVDAIEMPPAAMYRKAVAWLRGRGLVVTPPEFAAELMARAAAGQYLHHVAFSTRQFDDVVRRIAASGLTPQQQTSESAAFVVEPGSIVEIVRESGGDDAFWCPMHADVRAPSAGTCPLCGMDLVPMPPHRPGEYRMDVSATPARDGQGLESLRLTVRDPESGAGVEGFETVHERLLHLFVIGRDLEYFAHVHPVSSGDGRFTLKERIPPGAFMLIADFLPKGGSPQTVHRALVTPGYKGPLFGAPSLKVDTSDRIVDGVRVRLEAPVMTAGTASALRVVLTDAASGAPILDLEPWLGAAAHMLIVNAELTDAVHAHPENSATTGPSVSFEPLMPARGLYKLWVQFQRNRRLSTVSFVVSVQ